MPKTTIIPDMPQPLSLVEFNRRVKRLLTHTDVTQQWVTADLSDLAVRSGHCYLELVQKDPERGTVMAKVRGVIWANNYMAVRHKFETVTGQPLASGIKVMLCVSANYHEVFGLSVIVSDINPEYTIGDMERQRREILQRLQKEGVLDLNKQQEWVPVPQRIAIVSAPGAAGYGDFMNELHNNAYNLKFYTCLFPAVMQGERTAPSVIAALERIAQHIDLFDCVVVIRGGGSTSDLHAFDNYDIAANIAQFPIPVIVGIGHERDVTVLDYVANMRVKTPTAAADWLIARGADAIAYTTELANAVVSMARGYLSGADKQLAYISSSIPVLAKARIDSARNTLLTYTSQIPTIAGARLSREHSELQHHIERISQAAKSHVERETLRLKSLSDMVEVLSPRATLKRGYSLTMTADGRVITDVSQLKHGDQVATHLSHGSFYSIVK